MTCDNHSAIRMVPAPVFQIPPAGFYIPFAVPPPAQVESNEVRDLLVRVVELHEQRNALEADKERLAVEKVALEAELRDIREDNDGLKEEVKELRKRERVFQRKLKPDKLFLDVLVPMLKIEPKPTNVPAILDVEIRTPCGPAHNYDEIKTLTYNAVTGEIMKEKERLIVKSQKSATLRLTYNG